MQHPIPKKPSKTARRPRYEVEYVQGLTEYLRKSQGAAKGMTELADYLLKRIESGAYQDLRELAPAIATFFTVHQRAEHYKTSQIRAQDFGRAADTRGIQQKFARELIKLAAAFDEELTKYVSTDPQRFQPNRP